MYFSGVTDDQLRTIARGVATVSWGEFGIRPAVGKAVPPAMRKGMLLLMEELAGDHLDAMAMRSGGR